MIELDDPALSPAEREELERLLARAPHDPPTLEDMWMLMDEVWDELGCSHREADADKVDAFYRHPVWTLNGLFIERHPDSLAHRAAIVQWISEHINEIDTVADFGGGFGTLARMIGTQHQNLEVHIIDPYPSALATSRTSEIDNVDYVDKLKSGYDCIVSTDVLEHVSDPLALLATMRDATRLEGYLIVQNHFAPSIKCHVPSTFHLRFSFSHLARLMGLSLLGPCSGSHAMVYQKRRRGPIPWMLVRGLERISRLSGPPFRLAYWLKHR
jgi:2-polyprenyl-6-hydroxyphenyl methylase/3-demethylubiquinone-9 3-methyltransferase